MTNTQKANKVRKAADMASKEYAHEGNDKLSKMVLGLKHCSDKGLSAIHDVFSK